MIEKRGLLALFFFVKILFYVMIYSCQTMVRQGGMQT